MNNKEFLKSDQAFIEACSAANIEPTRRQASKWRNKKGLAYKLKYNLFRENKK